MKKILHKIGIGALAIFATATVNAQCPTIACPGDTTVNIDPGTCGAVVNYTTPVGTDTCSVAASPGNILFVCDGNNTTATEIPAELVAAGYTVTEVYDDHNSGTKDNTVLQAGGLSVYDAIYWHASGSGGFGDTHSAATFTALSSYVSSGGGVFVTGYDVVASPSDTELITFLGGTSSSDGGSAGTETLVGANSLTTGVTNIVGLTLAATGDHDGLNNLQPGTVGVATNGTSHGWTIRTLGAGEIALISTANSTGQPWTYWNTPGSGYNEALLNFASNHSCSGSANILFVCDGNNTTATEIPAELVAAGYTVTEVYNDHNNATNDNTVLQAGGLSAYDAIYWHASGSGGFGGLHSAATFTALSTYVSAGGAILVTGYDVIASPSDTELITFLGGTSSTDGGSSGSETLVGANSLTTGVTNIVGLTLSAPGDHDGLNNLQPGTVGVATNGSSHGWTIRTLGTGEIALISTANSTGQPWTYWNTPGSGYNEALLNFASNHSCSAAGIGAPVTTMTAGFADGATFPVGATTVTYEVVDGLGNNPQSCSFVVTVVDNEAPVADLATLVDVTGVCNITPATPTATDNCAGLVTGAPDVTFPINTIGTTVVTWMYDDGNGNIFIQTQNVIVSGVDTGVTQSGGTLTADASGVTYQWLNCDSSYAIIAGETNASYTPVSVIGNYAVQINDNGCIDTSACFLVDYTGLSDLDLIGISIYPNPSKGMFTVKSLKVIETLQVLDARGRIVHQASSLNSSSFEVNISNENLGVYYVRISGEFGTIVEKVVLH